MGGRIQGKEDTMLENTKKITADNCDIDELIFRDETHRISER